MIQQLTNYLMVYILHNYIILMIHNKLILIHHVKQNKILNLLYIQLHIKMTLDVMPYIMVLHVMLLKINIQMNHLQI